MKRHLSEEEIAAWVLGERPVFQKEHVAECGTCRGQVAGLDNALAGFRVSARNWAAGEQPAVHVPDARRWWQPRPLWAFAALAVALIVTIPVYETFSARSKEAAVLDAAADAALLNQVDAEISRAVPEPMEPLVNLVSWNISNSNR